MAAIKLNPKHKGDFHKHMHIPEDKPVTAADVMKGLHSEDAGVRSEGNFARMAKRHWKPLPKREKKENG